MARDQFEATARQLLAAVDADPWGDVSPSVYETARVTALAPWLPGHSTRVEYLLREQNADGTWGNGPAGYRLIPTLGAVSAVLAVLEREEEGDRLARAARRGLDALVTHRISDHPPDTAAAELIVPDLVEDINRRLAQNTLTDLTCLPIEVLPGYDRRTLDKVRSSLATAGRVPEKLHHTFEAIAQHCPDRVMPRPAGLLGSSPAATAAWINRSPATPTRLRAIAELQAVTRRYDGLCPEAAPLIVVERLWVLAALARAKLVAADHALAQAWIGDIYDPNGVRGAPGLAPDSDDTSVALHLARLVDVRHDLDSLAPFDNGTHFSCYLGEDTGSVSANAHVLQAMTNRGPEVLGTVRAVASWLLDQQHPDGYWMDKWHASPYYATAHCVEALSACPTDRARRALTAAAQWSRQTRRPDGRWGVWSSTAEESAYAIQILLHDPDHTARQLGDVLLHDDLDEDHPPLWHDKTVYAPHAVITAELIATSAQLAAKTYEGGRR